MAPKKAAVATAPTFVLDLPTTQSVRIALTQENKAGKQNASFIFAAQGEDLNGFLSDTCRKIVRIMEIQAQVKQNGGKNNAFGLTKSGEFELSIDQQSDNGKVKLLNSFTFNLKTLGAAEPAKVLCAMVEGYKLLTDYVEPETVALVA